MFYRYFRGLVGEYVLEMEKQAMLLLDTLDRGESKPATRRRSPAA